MDEPLDVLAVVDGAEPRHEAEDAGEHRMRSIVGRAIAGPGPRRGDRRGVRGGGLRLLRLRARRIPSLIEDAKDVLLKLYDADAEYSADCSTPSC